MRKIIAVFLFITSTTPSFAENLMIMGWDGAGLNNVIPLLHEDKLPNLQKLIDISCIVPIEIIGRTNTVCSWTQVFTGLTYDQTGVAGNVNFSRFSSDDIKKYWKNVGIYPNFNFWLRGVPYNHTVYYEAQNQGYKTAWITSKSDFLGRSIDNSPLFEIPIHADWFSCHNPPSMNEVSIEDFSKDTYIDEIINDAINFIQVNQPFFIFVHVNPDQYGHLYSENGARYLKEFERSDQALGALIEHINLAETKVIVMADHGFDEDQYGHQNAPDAWLVTTLPIAEDYCLKEKQRAFGTMRDVGITIFDWLGVDLKTKIPQIRGKSLLE